MKTNKYLLTAIPTTLILFLLLATPVQAQPEPGKIYRNMNNKDILLYFPKDNRPGAGRAIWKYNKENQSGCAQWFVFYTFTFKDNQKISFMGIDIDNDKNRMSGSIDAQGNLIITEGNFTCSFGETVSPTGTYKISAS